MWFNDILILKRKKKVGREGGRKGMRKGGREEGREGEREREREREGGRGRERRERQITEVLLAGGGVEQTWTCVVGLTVNVLDTHLPAVPVHCDPW